MKIYTNKRYNTVALYAIIVLAINVLLIVAILKFNSILNVLGDILSILSPIIWGIGISFLINPIMVFLENSFDKLKSKKRIKKGESKVSINTAKIKEFEAKIPKPNIKKKKKKRNHVRALSVTLSSVIFLGIVVGVIAIIIPELANSIMEISNNFSNLVETSQEWINKLLVNYPDISSIISKKLIEFGTDLTKLQPMFENLLSGAWGFVNGVKDFVLGFILSVYILFNKETLLAQMKKILFANFKKTTCNKILSFSNQANRTFSGFISGKIVDSLIIGLICFIILTIINMPYNILISVMIGVTNVIPFFGPFIGAIPSVILILLVEPHKFIWLLVVIFLIQQFDGYILGPKILGDSTGLPALWVMVSLFIGGGIFGFFGMLLSVPAFALIYSLIRSAIENKLIKKKLPISTEFYKKKHVVSANKKVRPVPLTPEELQKLDIPNLEDANEAK